MIGQGISDANRSLIEDFERIYPDYEVWATVIYCGFVGPSGDVPRTPENRSENATVYSRKTGNPVTLAGISITETLFLAEVMIKEQQIHGSRIQFDPRIVDRHTPTDILEAGWRCRHFWKGSDQNVPGKLCQKESLIRI